MSRRVRWAHIINFLIASFLLLLFIFPILNLLLTSFRPDAQTMMGDPRKFTPTLNNYVQIFSFTSFPLLKYLTNSIIISLGSTVLSLLLGIPAAYGIARFKVGGRNLAFTILSFRIIPPIVFALPMFILMSVFHLLDTPVALILAYLTFNLPLTVWVLKSFIRDIPVEIEEAAMIDGASTWRILVRIVTPLLGPGIASVTLLDIFFSWNEFLFALMLTSNNAVTMTLGTAKFITGYSILWGPLSAASIIGMLPMVALGVIFQKRLVSGLSLGALK